MEVIAFIVAGVAMAVLGYLSGWIVGLSGSGAASALFPLIFGLVTAAVTGLVSHVKIRKDLTKEIDAAKSKETISVLKMVQQRDVSINVSKYVIIASSLVLILCVATFFGIRCGTIKRSPQYGLDLSSLVPSTGKLSPEENSLIYKLLLDWESRGIPESMASKMLENTVREIYGTPEAGDSIKKAMLKNVTDNLTSGTTKSASEGKKD